MKFLYYFVILPISYLPTAVLYRLSDVMFYFMFYVTKYRKKVVIQNLRSSFPEKSPKEIEAIAKEFFRHLCDLIFESFKGFTISDAEIAKRHRFTNIEMLEEYYKQGKSMTILGTHYANWEWCAMSFPPLTKYQTYGIYQQLNNTFMDNLVKKSRGRRGMKLIAKKEVAPTLAATKGELITMGYIGDQSPSKHGRHYWMNFLGQPTACTSGYEFYAKEYNTPVIYLSVLKVRRGYYECTFIKVTDNPRDMREGAIVEIFMKELESIIRKAPAYWLWSHKRWKIKPPAHLQPGSPSISM